MKFKTRWIREIDINESYVFKIQEQSDQNTLISFLVPTAPTLSYDDLHFTTGCPTIAAWEYLIGLFGHFNVLWTWKAILFKAWLIVLIYLLSMEQIWRLNVTDRVLINILILYLILNLIEHRNLLSLQWHLVTVCLGLDQLTLQEWKLKFLIWCIFFYYVIILLSRWVTGAQNFYNLTKLR